MHRLRFLFAAVVVVLAGCQSGPVLEHQAADSQAVVRYGAVGYTPEQLAQILVGRTVLIYDPERGNQVAYFAEGGGASLWLPGAARIVPGRWRVQGSELCTRFGDGLINPLTLESSSRYACRPLARWREQVVASTAGDLFRLDGGKPPATLRRRPAYGALADLPKGR